MQAHIRVSDSGFTVKAVEVGGSWVEDGGSESRVLLGCP